MPVRGATWSRWTTILTGVMLALLLGTQGITAQAPPPSPTPDLPGVAPCDDMTSARMPFHDTDPAPVRTQAFANANSDFGGRYHPGEDWGFAGNPAHKSVYAIGTGNVVAIESVGGGDRGSVVVVEHAGSLSVPASADGAVYDHDASTQDTILSVYMHIDPDTDVSVGDCVTSDTELGVTTAQCPKATAAPTPTPLPAGTPCSTFGVHLHFEIRLAGTAAPGQHTSDWSVAGPTEDWEGGYFHDAQTMVDDGLRDPSAFVAANPGCTGDDCPPPPGDPCAVGAAPATLEPGAPTPVLSGHWIEPVACATIGTRPTLVAWPTATLDDVAITRVVFHARWDGGAAELCAASAGDADGLWSCTADLASAGVPAGPLDLTFDIFDDAGDMTAAADTEQVTLVPGGPKASWAKGTTKDASHVKFDDPVELVARVTDTTDLLEVRFTAYYPDWPNAKDAAKLPGFDPKRTWRTLAVCRPKGVTGDVATTKGCKWDGDRRSATVTYRWDPTIGETDRSVPWLPKADAAIATASQRCVPVTLAIDVVDASGVRASSAGGSIARRCDATAEGVGRTVYLDPLPPPAAPKRLTLALFDNGYVVVGWRLRWEGAAGAAGYRVYVVGHWFRPVCRPGRPIPEGQTDRRLLATVGARTTSLKGSFTGLDDTLPAGSSPLGYTFYVTAFNKAGESRPAVNDDVKDTFGSFDCS